MHLTSLPSPYGIGTMGKAAYDFVDFLAASGQTYWQLLPVGPTGYGDSPYQSFSAFAGNPYFIDLDILKQQGLLIAEDYENRDWGNDFEKVDYLKIYNNRFDVLRKAFTKFKQYRLQEQPFIDFKKDNASWLNDYALYMAIKFHMGGIQWIKWDKDIRLRQADAVKQYKQRFAHDIAFWEFVQYCFFTQWAALKNYANSHSVQIIGDIPIYVAYDSADVWANPNLFMLDDSLCPIKVAGCPPDSFSADGQLWGNPLYRWDTMKSNGYAWWIDRIKSCMLLYDVVRIDHFRAFDSYYTIPYNEKTAKNGTWCKGPGIAFFDTIKKALNHPKIIAEDLGFLTDSVHKLQKDSGYPGMKILQFAFDSREDSDYLPHNYEKNYVVYTGTHDNDTIVGWINTISKHDREFCKKYLNIKSSDEFHWEMIRAAWSSVANTAIAPIQDFLGLGSEARMNIPSTVGNNWIWRVKSSYFTPQLSEKILDFTKLYGRRNKYEIG